MSMCSWIDWLRLLPEHMGFWPQQTLDLAEYLSAVSYNITEHNHCITWNCALAVILVKCIVGNSQALLFHLVKMALEFLRTVHSEWIF